MKHQWLEVMGARRGLDKRGADELQRFARGFSGELELDMFVDMHGGNGWQVYRDVWISAGESPK